MLKPITEEERAKYTLKIQFQRGTEELLSEAYESGYNGYIDIWPLLTVKDNKLIMTVQSSKVPFVSTANSHVEALRYHVCQHKGCKRIK